MVVDGFFESVLKNIGAPVSTNNLSLLYTWAKYEGGDAQFNPLNTTQNANGATNFNSAGVKNYPDFKTGVEATAKTLQNKYYPELLDALKKNKPLNSWENNPAIVSNVRTWGTQNFASDLLESDVDWVMKNVSAKGLIIGIIALAGIGIILTLLFANKSEIESI